MYMCTCKREICSCYVFKQKKLNIRYAMKRIICDNLYFSSSSTKTTPLFTYNEKLQGVLSRHRNSPEEKKPVEPSDKLKSHELEERDLESQAEHTRPLDFRLSEAESTAKGKDEEIDTESTKKDDFHESSRKSSLSKDTQVIILVLILIRF